MGREAKPAPWNSGDQAILHTLNINGSLDRGRPDEVPTTLTPIRMAPGERAWVQGPFALYDHRAVGDGSYVHDGGFFFASGAMGAALTLTALSARAAGNASRRRQAAAATVPRWVQIGEGAATVTDRRIWFQEPHSLYSWSWTSMTSAALVSPHHLHFTGSTDSGRSIGWVFASDWAELAFTLWARACHPQHPQFVSRGWVPPGWAERAQARGLRDAGAPAPRIAG